MKVRGMPCRATQDRWVMVKSSDKTWSTGGGNGKPLQYSCRKNPMNSMKSQKDMTPEDETPRLGNLSWALEKVLTKCGPLEKGMANYFSILALRTPLRV